MENSNKAYIETLLLDLTTGSYYDTCLRYSMNELNKNRVIFEYPNSVYEISVELHKKVVDNKINHIVDKTGAVRLLVELFYKYTDVYHFDLSHYLKLGTPNTNIVSSISQFINSNSDLERDSFYRDLYKWLVEITIPTMNCLIVTAQHEEYKQRIYHEMSTLAVLILAVMNKTNKVPSMFDGLAVDYSHMLIDRMSDTLTLLKEYVILFQSQRSVDKIKEVLRKSDDKLLVYGGPDILKSSMNLFSYLLDIEYEKQGRK